MKYLSIGISDFKGLMKGKFVYFVYVDKTRYVCEIIKKETVYYFLSRPK